MRLPRRVPWASISELEQGDLFDISLCRALFHLVQLAAWRAITSLPLALESTHNLLAVLLQDRTDQTPSLFLTLRQAYAAAIIRFVNGLVDPLQLGAYARSVASIANQLGIPSWLVELRHAATHEDLPSLELLREAAKESMQWLLQNYFLPTLNPSSNPQSREPPLRPLFPLLKQYKALFKITTRDASMKAQFKLQTRVVLRDIERWITEAKVAASVFAISGRAVDDHEGESEDFLDKERWALLRLCDGLLTKGALVPLSKKKRAFSSDNFWPAKSLVALWEPLLFQLGSHHPEFPAILIKQITSRLSAAAPSNGASDTVVDSDVRYPPGDITYDMCIARWATWAVHTWSAVTQISGTDLRRQAVAALLTASGPKVTTAGQTAVSSLLRALIADDGDLNAAITTVLGDPDTTRSRNWADGDIDVMDKRLDTLEAMTVGVTSPEEQISMTIRYANPDAPEVPVEIAPGWRLLQGSFLFRARPIGIFESYPTPET